MGGNTCTSKAGNHLSSCLSVGLDVGGNIPINLGMAWYNSYSDIAGHSIVSSGGFCFFVCFGGGVIKSTEKGVIGGFFETGFGLGVSGSVATCTAAATHTDVYKIDMGCPDGQEHCACYCQPCFPSDAIVETPAGPKAMAELSVG